VYSTFIFRTWSGNIETEEIYMTEAQTLKTLQLFYAGVLVDAVRHYEKHGILDAVTASKKQEQEMAAPAQLTRLGITDPEGLFSTFSSIFGCAQWSMEKRGEVFYARTSACLACALAKKLGTKAPCDIFCINPFIGLAKALPESKTLEVRETLWEGSACLFELR
jgi:hypothetical protein